MKLKDLKPASITKPFVKTKELEIHITHVNKKIQSFKVILHGEEKLFPVKNHSYLETFKKVENFIKANL